MNSSEHGGRNEILSEGSDYEEKWLSVDKKGTRALDPNCGVLRKALGQGRAGQVFLYHNIFRL